MKNNIFCIRMMEDGRIRRIGSSVVWKPIDGWKHLKGLLDVRTTTYPKTIGFTAMVSRRSII